MAKAGAAKLLSTEEVPAARRLIIAVAVVYLGVVLLGPTVTLAWEAMVLGLPAILTALATAEALQALRMSIVLTAIAVAVNAVVGCAGAVVLTRHRFLGRRLINTLADLPLAVSPVMVGLAFLLIFGRNGYLEPLLDVLHFKVVFAFTGLVLGTLFVTLPYTLREIAYVLEEIGASEEEAAVTLGASAWQAFWHVTLPNIRHGLAYGLLMTMARALGEFGAVLVIGGSISGQTQTATTFIHDALEEREVAGAYGMALLLAVFSIVLLLALGWAQQQRRRLRR